jgi:hypothetical protein
VVATVLLAAIIGAIVVHGALAERSEQRALTAQVTPLPVDRGQTRTRNAA